MESVVANGVRFAYLAQGEGPLVLLIHGFPDTAYSWDPARAALAAAGYRAVSPFTRGYAPTGLAADGKYDAETLGLDVLALIAALGADKAIVVGHDWGATAAYSAAATAPERVECLVTVGIPHLASVRPLPRLIWGARHMLRFQRKSAGAMLSANDFAHVDELVQRWSPTWKFGPEETAPVKEAFRQPGCLEAALGYYRTLRPWPSVSVRKKITVPSAVFSGADDPYVKLSDYERAQKYYTRGCEIVRVPGGHFMHREHPARFNEELVSVIGSLRKAAAATPAGS